MNINFNANKTPIEIMRKKELILEIFFLVVMVNGIENHGENFMS